MTSRIMKVALALAVFFLMSGASVAQQGVGFGQRDNDRWSTWHYQDRDHDRDDDRGPYDRGLRDGREDREHNRGWHPRNNGRKYVDGYRAGYGHNGGGWQGRRNDHDADDAYRNGPYNNGGYRNAPYPNGPYGNVPTGRYGNNPDQIAYNNGYKTGMDYGAADRNNRHSYRPTYSSTYQNGTAGYTSSYGSQTAYKHSFQNGYRAGYDRGYGPH